MTQAELEAYYQQADLTRVQGQGRGLVRALKQGRLTAAALDAFLGGDDTIATALLGAEGGELGVTGPTVSDAVLPAAGNPAAR